MQPADIYKGRLEELFRCCPGFRIFIWAKILSNGTHTNKTNVQTILINRRTQNGIMHIVTQPGGCKHWKPSPDLISSRDTMKMSLFYPFCLLITVLQLTFCQFLVKNCGQIFSNVVFLLVNIVCYPATIPVYQLDFMVLNDISNALWFQPKSCKVRFQCFSLV